MSPIRDPHQSDAGLTPTLFTPQTLAARYGLPVATIYQWRSNGKGPRGFRVGKFVRYRLADVEAWEQEQIDKEQLAHAS